MMIEVTINAEVSVSFSPQYGEEGQAIVMGLIPPDVAKWVEWSVEKNFSRSHEEEQMGWLTCSRKIVFEVDVDVYDNGTIKTATCQTMCPLNVKAWIEVEAMKQFKAEKEKVA